MYPKSEEAYKKTIELELHAVKENDGIELYFWCPVPTESNGGRTRINVPAVEMSNFAGFALTVAYMGRAFSEFLHCGAYRCWRKIALGIFQTHNRTADTRMEAFVYYLALREAPIALVKKVMKL